MPVKKSKKESFQAPRGMRDVIGQEYLNYQGFFEKAAEIALYYGFKPIWTPILEKTELFERAVGEDTDVVGKEMYSLRTRGNDKLSLRPEGTAGVMRAYIENGMQSLPQPVMLYYEGTFYRHDKPQRGRHRELRQFGLEMIGTNKSVADAMTIHITNTILNEVGAKDLTLQLNSIGDRESRPAYIKDLNAYYRKNLKELCKDCKERLKTNPLRLLDCKECEEVKASAPTPISTLNDYSKKHFKEVLEYLDELGINYEINSHLVRGLDYYSHTVFEFIYTPEETEGEEGEDSDSEKEKNDMAGLSVASGGRYDGLAKEIGSKKDVPAVGVGMGVDRILLLPEVKNLAPRVVKKPKVFFIQLGFEAKLKSLQVVEILREAKIPVKQSLSKDSLGSQLATAEKMKLPIVIILGQKEVVDNTVIVRNMADRSQKSIPVDKLADYIKKIK